MGNSHVEGVSPVSVIQLDEAERIKTLHKYSILDTEPEPAFDDIVRLATHICNTPIAAINFTDERRVWSKAAIGLPYREIPRQLSACNYTIRQPELMLVSDATQDKRFATNPAVTRQSGLRFYAGVPLVTPEGYAIGTLCVMDLKPRDLAPQDRAALWALARQVTTHLELRRSVKDLEQAVTESQKATLALQASEQRFRALFEASPVGVVILRFGILLYANPRALAMFGYHDLQEVVGEHIFKFTSPETHTVLGERIELRIQGERPPPIYEAVGQRKDGSTFPVYVETSLVQWPDGETAISFLTDITEQKRSKEQLENSLTLLRTTLESTADGILVVNLAGRIVAYNQKYLEMLRIPVELMAQGDIKAVRQYVGDQLKDPETIMAKVQGLYGQLDVSSHDILEFKDGRILEIYSQAERMDGKSVGRVWSFRDVTASRRAQEALQRQSAFLRQVIDMNPNLIFAKDREGRFTLVNQTTADIYGAPVEEIVGKSDADFNANNQEVRHFRRIDLEVMETRREYFIAEEMITDHRGKLHWLQTVKRPLVDEDGVVRQLLGVATDVTERKQLEEQLRQSQKMEAIGRLAGGIAHDFNNLLMTIYGCCAMSFLHLPPGSPARRYVEEIEKAGERGAALIRQLLTFGRRQVLQVKPLDLNLVLTDMEGMIKRLVGEHIQVMVTPGTELGFVMADPGQIEQMLLNLVVNAKDAMPEGGRLLIQSQNINRSSGHSSAGLQRKLLPYVLLTVSDNGQGIDPTIRPHIFEPFFTTKERGKGTGLGLATVYSIVEQSGGKIDVESQVGKGTTFRIFFPCVDQLINIPASPARINILPRGSETVLLVEDDEIVRHTTRDLLQANGYQVLEAANPGEALLICEQHKEPIGLLLTDVVMPMMDGSELAKRLLKLRPTMQVLFMSGYTDDAVLRQGIQNEGMAFLQKPFTASALAYKLREILEKQV
jgi:PAS domain S-box-containing protein